MKIKSETARLEAMIETFNSPGWKHFEEMLEEARVCLDTVSGISTAEQLHKAQGQLQQIDYFLALPTVTRHQLELLEDDSADYAQAV